MIAFQETPGGTEISVKVVPRSSRSRVAGIMGGRLKVCVAAAPERGKANAEAVRIIAAHFGIPQSRVRIVSGETSPLKQVLLHDMPAREVKEKA